jgi:comEA protein
LGGININSFKKIGSMFGLSEIESKVLSFVFISLFVGIGAYYLKYKDEIIELKQFDYSAQDSLFENDFNSINGQKKVDYEEELYDFSDDELESILTKVNINLASLEELILLPGIGKKTAEKIIKYRESHGKYSVPSDLLNVSGIGEKKLEKMKSLLIIE